LTNLEVFVGPPMQPTELAPGGRRGVVLVVVAAVVALLGAVVATGLAAPGLLGTWTTRATGGVPASITTPWAWQASVQDSPPGPASLIFTGDGTALVDDDTGRIGVVGRNGTYRNLYPDDGRWTAGGNAHLSPDGRFIASLRLHGTASVVSVTDLTTGEVRDLPAWQGREVFAVYGWRPDGEALAIGFRAGSPLSLGVLDLATGQTTPTAVIAGIPELAGDVTVVFSPDGRRFAVAIGSTMALYEAIPATPIGYGDYVPLWTVSLDAGQNFSGVFTPDGRRIVLFRAPACAPLTCPAALTWSLSYLDAGSGEIADGPTLRPFAAAAVRAVGWNETTGGLVVVGLTPRQVSGPTDRDARQLVQPGSADLYELRTAEEPRLLVHAPDAVTGLDVAADLVRAGRFGDRPSVPSLWPFERSPVDLVGVAVVSGIVVAVGAVVFVRWWQGRRRGRHRASRVFRPRPH
jgi:hypothetical protein